MTVSRPDRLQEFGAIVHVPDPEIPLCYAALLFAADTSPTLDISSQLSEIRELGDQIKSRLGTTGMSSPTDTLRSFLTVFHQEYGFRGDDITFDAPENSQLHRVLERRQGLPITLTVLAVELLRHLGLEAYGVALPGRYIGRCETESGPIWFDPFSPGTGAGSLLTEADCVGLALSYGMALSPTTLRQSLSPARHHSTLARMLNNLVGSYNRRNQHLEKAQTLDWNLLLQPGDPDLTLARGLAYHSAGMPGLAMRDLDRYCHMDPPQAHIGTARELLRQLRSANPMN